MTVDDELREWSFAVGDSAVGLRVHGITRWLIDHTLYPYFRVTVRGREKLDQPGPLVVAPVHRSNLDSLMVPALSRRRLRALAKESLFEIKPLAWYLSALGAFPLARGTADRDAMRASRVVLDRGEPLMVFPEGTRQSGRQVGDLFDGTMWLAARSAATVVPVGIAGTEAALPPNARLPRRTRCAFVVGEPIPPPAGRPSRRVISELTSELKVRLQAANDQAHLDAGQTA